MELFTAITVLILTKNSNYVTQYKSINKTTKTTEQID